MVMKPESKNATMIMVSGIVLMFHNDVTRGTQHSRNE